MTEMEKALELDGEKLRQLTGKDHGPTLLEDYLQIEVLSPFLPGTKIQYAWIEEKAVELIGKSITVGECWLCHLAPNAKGYSPVSIGGRNGIKFRAHRLVFIAFFGALEEGILVCHTCDNRRCIRPEHLFSGTSQDNTDDMIIKGRKVDDPEVGLRRKQATANLIRPLLAQGLGRHAIADKLGISSSTVWNYTDGPYRDFIAFPSGHESDVCLG